MPAVENAGFIAADVNDGIGFPEGNVDLVHSRLVQAGISKDQWPEYFKEVFRVLKPETGWVQVTEPVTNPLDLATEDLPSASAFHEVISCLEL